MPFSPPTLSLQVKAVDLKKLVYSYLVYHADVNETCRELTLLAINTFQKDLSNRNQLIRALALRIMCGIRVRDIIAIQVMTVKKAAFDTSPYVRKVACLCVPKVYALDASMGGELAEVVEKLLHDRSTMVLSSAVAAWREVCPARYDMLHSVYRKLVHTMADFDEWGQILALQTLTEYARTQFVDPRVGTDALRAAAAERAVQKKKTAKKDKKKKKKGFYSDESSVTDSDAEEESGAAGGLVDDGDVSLDADHDLLLRASLPLLRSRSTAVVLQVAAVYSALAPRSRETSIQVGEALTRCMRSHREVQYLLLGNIVTMAKTTPGMFRRYLKQFFIAESEPQFVKGMKVDILAALAAPDNAGLILKELTAYVKHDDKDFAVKAIRAAAAVGTAVPEVANRVLRGLMALVASPEPEVVAHAVVAIRQLLQQKTTTGDGVILQLVGMLPQISTAAARSSMVWLVGEFLHKPAVAHVAPDTLRILAKGFRDEQPSVKEQIVTLAAKIWAFLFLPRDSGVVVAATATAAAGTSDPTDAFKSMLGEDGAEADRRRRVVDALVKYVIELARNDTSYDLRDRVRLIKALLFTPPMALATADAVDRALAVLTGQAPAAVQSAQVAAEKADADAQQPAAPPGAPGSDADIPDISAPADGAVSGGGSDAGSAKAESDAASQTGSVHSADAAGSDAPAVFDSAAEDDTATAKSETSGGDAAEDAASTGAASAAEQEASSGDGDAAAAGAGAAESQGSSPEKAKQDIADSEAADLASGSTGAAAAAWGSSDAGSSDKMRGAAAVQASASIIRSILLVHKPPPVLQNASASSDAFRLGSMSHSLGQSMNGYVPLPHWAEEPSNPDVRDPAKYEAAQAAKQAAARAAAAAAAEEEDSTDTEEDTDDDSASTASGSSSGGSSSGSGSSSDSGSDDGSDSDSSSGSGSSNSSSSDEE